MENEPRGRPPKLLWVGAGPGPFLRRAEPGKCCLGGRLKGRWPTAFPSLKSGGRTTRSIPHRDPQL